MKVESANRRKETEFRSLTNKSFIVLHFDYSCINKKLGYCPLVKMQNQLPLE